MFHTHLFRISAESAITVDTDATVLCNVAWNGLDRSVAMRQAPNK
jgi:hypothetical protein